ncbi:hypothetical protein OAG71_02530 [bacterium]|nr:hypothetical protein [bacterium]
MKTIEDICNDGGKCEKIAPGFLRCTDPSGKVYWCTEGGTCVPMPSEGVSGEENGSIVVTKEKLLAVVPHPTNPKEQIEIIYQQKPAGQNGGKKECFFCTRVGDTMSCKKVQCPPDIIDVLR